MENLSYVVGVPCGSVLGMLTLNDKHKNTAGEVFSILLTDFVTCSNLPCHGFVMADLRPGVFGP